MSTQQYPEYYCEYYYAFGQWELIGSKTQPGYYCPSEPPSDPPGQQGETMIDPPWPISSKSPEFPDQEYFVEYEYRDGNFHVRQANCPEGFCAPSDPIELAKTTGTLRVFPVRIKGSSGESTPPDTKPGELA